MTDNPPLLLVIITAGLYMISIWKSDYRAACASHPKPHGLPGATPASLTSCAIAAVGALVILGVEIIGEIYFGLSSQQSSITVLFGFYTLIAAFIEELIFRGFIVIEGRGAKMRWAGIVSASVLFSPLHPFLWTWQGRLYIDGR